MARESCLRFATTGLVRVPQRFGLVLYQYRVQTLKEYALENFGAGVSCAVELWGIFFFGRASLQIANYSSELSNVDHGDH